MRTTRPHRRGFTIVEMLITMTIMGIVLALALVEFAMVYNHNNLMNANLSADQNARIAMAKVTNDLRQAMPDLTDYPSSSTIVITPTMPPASTAPSPVQTVQFYRVHNGPGGLVVPIPTGTAGDPLPCYDTVTLAYDPVARTITKTVTLITNTHCPTASTSSSVLAHNIVGFGVTAVSGTAGTATLFDVDLQTVASRGNYGIYDLNSQVAMGYSL